MLPVPSCADNQEVALRMGPGSASALIGALSLEQAWHSSPGAGSLAHQKVRRSQEQLRGPLVCWALGNHPERSLQPSVTEQGKIRAKECRRDQCLGEESCVPHTQHAGRCLSRTRGRWCAWSDLVALGRALSCHAQAASSSSAPWGAPAQHPAALRPGVSARFGAMLCQLAF